ncbi:MAG: hypothetical protein M1832_001993 [Thelocarpon impressellum]|nr:MAG: hypothetical protein M1832_001993 [Thelocarpon impressellum]
MEPSGLKRPRTPLTPPDPDSDNEDMTFGNVKDVPGPVKLPRIKLGVKPPMVRINIIVTPSAAKKRKRLQEEAEARKLAFEVCNWRQSIQPKTSLFRASEQRQSRLYSMVAFSPANAKLGVSSTKESLSSTFPNLASLISHLTHADLLNLMLTGKNLYGLLNTGSFAHVHGLHTLYCAVDRHRSRIRDCEFPPACGCSRGRPRYCAPCEMLLVERDQTFSRATMGYKSRIKDHPSGDRHMLLLKVQCLCRRFSNAAKNVFCDMCGGEVLEQVEFTNS